MVAGRMHAMALVDGVRVILVRSTEPSFQPW